MSLGDLVISLSANTARFDSDMGKAAQMVERWGNQVGNSAKAAEIAIAKMSNVGITSVDRLQQSFNKLNIKSGLQIDREAANIQAAFERIKNSGVASADEIRRANVAMKQQLAGLDGSGNFMKGHIEGMNGFSLASVAAIAKIQILYSLINNTMSAIGSMPGKAIDAIENYKTSIITNAALITSQAQGVKNVGEEYKKNKVYTEAVEKVLIRMDTQTAASYEQLQLMNRAYMLQGVYLDINNKKAIEGRRNTANALAVIAAGSPNPNMQYGQEIRGLMSGTMREGNMLLQMAIGIDKDIVAKIERWKKAGTIDENLGKLFSGFAAAQGDIDNLWATVKSTMSTVRDDILRGGLAPAFAEIVKEMKNLSRWTEDNKEKIQAFLKDFTNDVKAIIGFMWKWRDTIKDVGSAVLWGSITLGITSVMVKVTELYKAWAAGEMLVKGGLLSKVIANPLLLAAATAIYGGAKAVTQVNENERLSADAARANQIASGLSVFGNKGPQFNAQTMGQFQNVFPNDGPELLALAKSKGLVQLVAENLAGGSSIYKLKMDVEAIRKLRDAVGVIATPPPGKGGVATEAADYTDRWNSYVDALRSFENKGEGNSYAGQIKKIDEQLENLKATYGGLDAAHKKLTDGLHEGGAIKYFEKLAKTAKDTAWYLNMQKEAQEGLNQASSDKAIFNIKNMQTGDLSTKRYNITSLYDKHALSVDERFAEQQGTRGYRLRTNDQYSIPFSSITDADREAANTKIGSIDAGLSSKMEGYKGDTYASKLDKLKKQHTDEIKSIEEYEKMKGAVQEKALAARLKNDETYAAAKQKLDKDTALSAIASVGNSIGQIGEAMMQGNKEQFEAGKKMAIASAGISMTLGAIQAFTSMSSIPYVGPALGAIAAAAVVASGMSNIARIESQQYQGREFGGPVTAGQSYIVGEKRPELFTPGASGMITPYVPEGKGKEPSFTQVNNFSTGVVDTVRAEMSRAMPTFIQMSLVAFKNAQRSGQFQPG